MVNADFQRKNAAKSNIVNRRVSPVPGIHKPWVAGSSPAAAIRKCPERTVSGERHDDYYLPRGFFGVSVEGCRQFRH
jgi:hypothetical protein